MERLYNQEYYTSYCGPVPYDNTDVWTPHFERIAEHIVRDFNPRTVLDAGCAMGYLVAALRDRNVEAYGIDISEYAISKVREDLKPFCTISSLTNALPSEFPSKYDLIVSIEVLEHLSEDDGAKALTNLCSITDTILFSSSPDDFEEKTHVNVKPGYYWAKKFFELHFFNRVSLQPDYITEYAACFQRFTDCVKPIEEYEKGLEVLRIQLKQETENARQNLNNAMAQIEKTKEQIQKVKERDEKILKLRMELKQEEENAKQHLNNAIKQIEKVRERDELILKLQMELKQEEENAKQHLNNALKQIEKVRERDEIILKLQDERVNLK